MIWPLLTLGKLHHIFLMVLAGELYTAPIPENISQVLDLGTGTGAWAMDLAEYVNPARNKGPMKLTRRIAGSPKQ